MIRVMNKTIAVIYMLIVLYLLNNKDEAEVLQVDEEWDHRRHGGCTFLGLSVREFQDEEYGEGY